MINQHTISRRNETSKHVSAQIADLLLSASGLHIVGVILVVAIVLIIVVISIVKVVIVIVLAPFAFRHGVRSAGPGGPLRKGGWRPKFIGAAVSAFVQYVAPCTESRLRSPEECVMQLQGVCGCGRWGPGVPYGVLLGAV